MRGRVIALAVLVVLSSMVPVGASANDCPSVAGDAIYNFGTEPGVGVANLRYDGERIFVPFEGVSFAGSGGIIKRVTDWHFPDGTVRLEETYELIPVGSVFKFHATVAVLDGGTGAMEWDVNSNPTVTLNTFRQIEGSLCLGT